MNGVLLVDKQQGMTSFDVVRQIRHKLQVKRVGHAGTLDPMATGLLLVLVGEATKLEPHLSTTHKTYLATVQFGTETDSGDADGRTLRQLPIDESLTQALRSPEPGDPVDLALAEELSRVEQVPPVVSAIHVAGERSYARARRGEHFELPRRPVAVLAIERQGHNADAHQLTVKLTASKGYYVRAFARDLAERLGTLGHLVALRRTQAGSFDLDHAVLVNEARARHLLSLAEVVSRTMPSLALTDEGERFARQGKLLSSQHFATSAEIEGPCGWFYDGDLVAIGTRSAHQFRVVRGFGPPLPLPTTGNQR